VARPLLFALEQCPAPDRVRELAAPVIVRWTERQAQRLVGEILAVQAGGPDNCPDWGTAALHVPDLIEEMVSRVLEDGGEISVSCDGSSSIAARLHFPVAPQ
jgi:hypothetical protein